MIKEKSGLKKLDGGEEMKTREIQSDRWHHQCLLLSIASVPTGTKIFLHPEPLGSPID